MRRGGALPAPPPEIEPVPVVMLVDTGAGQQLFARRADLPFVPASMTKVMTAYVAFELIAQGKLSLHQHITVSPETAAQWSGQGTSMYLKAGERVSVDMLLHGIATASANDASVVLAEGIAGDVPRWSAMMNGQAQKLGMKNSHFHTPNGWPDNGQTYVSAQDLVKLASAMIARHPRLYRHFFGQKRMVWHGQTLMSHDPTVGVVPGADGIKTGYTREAGYNFLGTAERDGRRLIMVIGGAKTGGQRAAAARNLLEWGFSRWQSRRLFEKDQVIGSARVQGGNARLVGLVTPRPVSFANYDPAAKISLSITYQGPLEAPLAKGQAVARLRISAANGVGAEVPLVTAQAVKTAGPLDRMWNGLMKLFS